MAKNKGYIETIDSIIGIGLKSNYKWNGEDLIEALKEDQVLLDHR